MQCMHEAGMLIVVRFHSFIVQLPTGWSIIHLCPKVKQVRDSSNVVHCHDDFTSQMQWLPAICESVGNVGLKVHVVRSNT